MNKNDFLNCVVENRKNPAFIKQVVLLFLGILLLVFSFLPIVSYTYEDKMYGGTEIEGTLKVKISPIQNIVLMFDSFKDDAFENIEDSDLFSEYEDIEEELWEAADNGKLSSKEEKIFSELLYLNARINLQGERANVKLPFIVGTLISLGYIALTVLLCVYTLLDIISFFKGKENDSKRTLKLLSAIPIATIINYYATSSAMYRTYLFAGADVKFGSGVVLSIIFSIIGLAGWIIYSWLVNGFKFGIKRHGSRVITLVVAFFALMTIFMPLMKMSLTAEFEGRSTETTVKVSYDSGFFGSLDVTDDEKREYRETMSDGYFSSSNGGDWTDSYGYLSTINSFDNYSVSEYRSGIYSASVDSKLEYIFSVDDGYKIYWLLNLIPVFTLVIGVGFGIITWQQMYLLVSDEEKSNKQAKKLSIITLSAAVIVTVLVSVFIGMTMSDIRYYTGSYIPSNVQVDFNLLIGSGCIFTILLGAIFTASTFIPKLLELENAEITVSETAELVEESFTTDVIENDKKEELAVSQVPVIRKTWKREPKRETKDVVSELKQYKELLDCGIITQEEFDIKKAQLLNLPKTED